MPQQIGEFRRVLPVRLSELPRVLETAGEQNVRALNDGSAAAIAARSEYALDGADRFIVEVVRFRSDTEAYSFLTLVAEQMKHSAPAIALRTGEVGTANVTSAGAVAFSKGPVFIRITQPDPVGRGTDNMMRLAQLLAAPLDAGEGEIPVLIKHLPDWENAQQVIYSVTLESLKLVVPNQPVLDVIEFDAGAEAVAATYGTSRMVIVEFTTPQIAGENDSRIMARLQQLREQGQNTPSGYKRVGNYSVFVFNAPSEQVAQELIGQVKYEQVVQWLGEDPYWFQRAERHYVETTASVLVVVVKASGLALLICLAVGGLFGALLFTHRRRRRPREVFSDAGGMLRLNLDEMTAQTDPRRLIGRGN